MDGDVMMNMMKIMMMMIMMMFTYQAGRHGRDVHPQRRRVAHKLLAEGSGLVPLPQLGGQAADNVRELVGLRVRLVGAVEEVEGPVQVAPQPHVAFDVVPDR